MMKYFASIIPLALAQLIALHLLDALAERPCQAEIDIYHKLCLFAGKPFDFLFKNRVQSLESFFHAKTIARVVGHWLSIVVNTECL